MTWAEQKERRDRLWHKDPKCRCCGVITVLPGPLLVERNGRNVLPGPIPKNLATIQHYDSRYSKQRGSGGGWDWRTTLYCWECNDRDSRLEQASVPVEERRRRSEAGHHKKGVDV